MIPQKSSRRSAYCFALMISVAALFAAAVPLHAQGRRDNSSGFYIGGPRYFVGIHSGISIPNAGSDLFGMITQELTLKKSDFNAMAVGADLGIPFRTRFAVVIGVEYSLASLDSESRNFTEDNGDPIRQKTTFSQVPITATLRFYPMKTGETVGSYAWIPRRILPYVGAGAGAVRYNFSQDGDFVDSETLDIFSAELKSNGFVATEHIVAGVDMSVTPRVLVNVEARYSWAKANLSDDFTGFKRIDLAGLRLIGGVHVRF